MLGKFRQELWFVLLFYICAVCYGQSTNESPSTNQTEIEGILNYLTTYTGFSVQGPADTAASSSNGDTNGAARPSTEELISSPAFVENVILIQTAAGLDKTGIPDAALMKQVKKSRCGMSDPPPPGSGIAEFSEKSRWISTKSSTGKYHLTYSFFTETFPNGLVTDIQKGLLAAMCLWEKNSNVRFTEDLGQSVSSADVTISFGQASHGDGFPFDGTGGTLAHAFYPESGKLHFDLAENWYLSTDNKDNRAGKDIFTVAAHELGHSLGLKHSGVSGALMAPYYRFVNSFEDYKLPADEQEGMAELYGSISGRSVVSEKKSACYKFNKKYGTNKTPTTFNPTRVPTTKPKTKPATIPKPGGVDCSDQVPAQTCTNFKKDHFCEKYPDAVKQLCPLTCGFCTVGVSGKSSQSNKFDTATCFDQYSLEKCNSWKNSGYCTKSNGVQSMVRLCQATCDYCPVVMESKPATRSNTPKTVCDIKKFDAVSVRNDYGKYFYADFIKEDYYFPVEVQLPYFSLLDKTYIIKDYIQWAFDPKVVPAVHYKFNSQRKFLKTGNVKAVLRNQAQILIVQSNGQVDEYRNDGPFPVHVSSHALTDVFIGHPFSTVDAAYSEYDRDTRQYVITLFNHQSIWQYMEWNTQSSVFVGRRFYLIGSKTIKKWLGVDACDVDAVFDYKGSPYFLKNNIFWPASDKQPQVARDVSYNIFRCWKNEPQNLRIPFECNTATRKTYNLKNCVLVLLIFVKSIFN